MDRSHRLDRDPDALSDTAHQQRQRVDLGERIERQVDALELERDTPAQAVAGAGQDQRQRGDFPMAKPSSDWRYKSLL
jgi:hypothetical protein